MMKRILFFVTALLLPPSDAAAQRLRVTTDAGLEVGAYRLLTDTTLVIASGTPTTIALSRISRLEYSRGRRASTASSVAGFFAGALVGGLAGCAANRDDYGVFCGGQNDSKVVTGAAIGGAVGIGLAGALFKREHWRTIDVNELRRMCCQDALPR